MDQNTIRKRTAGDVSAGERHNVVACVGGEATVLEERAAPAPGTGEMVLGLRVVGLCGTDLFKLETGRAAAGTVLGHELVGTVVDLGQGVSGFTIGDRVAVPHHVPCGECVMCRRGSETLCAVFRDNLMEPGAFADTVLIKRRAVELAARRLPDHVSDGAAVFMEPAGCVLRGVHRAELARDGAAVVQGAGSMGLLHLLVLRAVYPELSVIVVDPVEDRLATARTLGASATGRPGDAAREAVLAVTNGLGADAVFETVGGGGPLEAALGLTREGGSVVLFAYSPEDARAGFDLNHVFKYERRIIGTYSAALKEQEEIFGLLESGALDPSPLVTHTLPLDDFQDGVALARNREALKVLFTPSRGSAGG
jgi:L-iditol 2-dehydrogenase